MILEYQFSFASQLLIPKDLPNDKVNEKNFIQILEYNNCHHGIIDNEFLKWALQNNISYKSILWFVKEFSNQSDQELLWLIDAYFCPYKFYCDESSNCVKLRFKDEQGNLNIDWRNDFVLAGVVFEETKVPFNIDELFKSLNLQKNITDAKLKHIANYNGADVNRFIDILKSDKVSLVLKAINNSDAYLHWSTQSLLYFALVDIVDSVIEIPMMLDDIKNVLYKYVRRDVTYFLSFLASYNYPNIAPKKSKEFYEGFITWIELIEAESIEDEFLLEFLRQGMKSSKKSGNLLFLTDNTDKLLIENFVPLYASRLGDFLKSTIYFDKVGIVEDNIKKYENVFCSDKIPYYDFLDSEQSKWIQLSDFISGIIAALLAFVNQNDLDQINLKVKALDDVQIGNLRLLMNLIRKSSNKNKYFDHMSCNYEQGLRIQHLMHKAG